MPLPAVLRTALEPLLELAYPTRCVGCGASGSIWCAACRARLRPVSSAICLRCRRELIAGVACPACGPQAPRAWAAAVYQPPLDRALTHLKYRPEERLASALAEALANSYRRHHLSATVVVPVPLSRRRRNRRGYNQTELLGRALAGMLNLPLRPSAVSRTRDTGSQVGLEAGQRWANVVGAFEASPDLVRGQAVLLIDDVQTTGATLAACAEALTMAGATRLTALTVGRA